MPDPRTPHVACPQCSAQPGEYCRTPEVKALLSIPHPSRSEIELAHLRRQRDDLQAANTREVLARRRLQIAAQYVVDNLQGYEGLKDRLRCELEGQHGHG